MSAVGAPSAFGGLSVHQNTSWGSTGACAVCHNTSPTPELRGWGISFLLPGGKEWYTRPIAPLCYPCHHVGNSYGANPMEIHAYDDLSHGFTVGSVNVANAWALGVDQEEIYAGNGLPYVGPAGSPRDIDCTTCHKVHNNDYVPFSMKGETLNGFDFSPLCKTCHLGRVNPGAVGPANTVGAGGLSTHPTDVPVSDIADNGGTFFISIDARLTRSTSVDSYTLGGKLADATATGNMTCQTCHAVHGDQVNTTQPADDLLAIPNVNRHATGDSAGGRNLCTGCHGNPYNAGASTVGSGDDHPMDGSSGWPYYPSLNPADWAGPNGIPLSWTSANHFDSGATEIGVAAGGPPACSSCHDVHGGLAGTSLLYGPNTQGTGDWCFCCHPASLLVPDYHHSVQGNYTSSVIFCGDCHGSRGQTSDSWSAHNGFYGFRVSLQANSSALCESCHLAANPADFTPAGTDFSGPVLPAHHGPSLSSLGGDSHPVDSVTSGIPNLLRFSGNWAALPEGPADVVAANHPAGVLSKWGSGGEILCESCHNILENVGNRAMSGNPVEGGWQANLLLLGYEDDTAGAGSGESPDFLPGASSGDEFCRVCHNYDSDSDGSGDGSGGYVHYPAAHTAGSSYNYGVGESPYGRVSDGILTDGSTACPERSTADAPAAPGTFSYPTANEVNCDSCHRPHNGWTASAASGGGITGHIIVQDPSAQTAPKTTPCSICHSIDIMCGY